MGLLNMQLTPIKLTFNCNIIPDTQKKREYIVILRMKLLIFYVGFECFFFVRKF